jgi:hypothetical protein
MCGLDSHNSTWYKAVMVKLLPGWSLSQAKESELTGYRMLWWGHLHPESTQK